MKKKISLVIFAVAIFLDQLSKYIAIKNGLELTLNPGISLSFLGFLPSGIMSVLLFALVILIFYFFKKEWLSCPMATGLFFGGAVSNLVDRLYFGGVRDWLPIPFVSVHNNLSDWFIFAGLVLIILKSLKSEKLSNK